MSSLNDNIVVLKACIASAESEIAALQSGKKSAAVRARKVLMDVKNKAHLLRSEVTEYVKSLPTKSRKKQEPVDEPIVEQKKDM